MYIQHVVGRLLSWGTLRSAAEIDAEIRDELEFHLEMQTDENERAGMSAEEARRDAERRFGDFEASRRACQKIDLGPQLLVQRMQLGLLILLAAAVLYQANMLMQVRARSADQIEALTRTIQQLQNIGQEQPSANHTMSYIHWTPDVGCAEVMQASRDAEVLVDWKRTRDVLATPWSDWHGLADDSEGL